VKLRSSFPNIIISSSFSSRSDGADAMMEDASASASDELKDDKDFILVAVALDEMVLAHASERLKDDKAVVIAALANGVNFTLQDFP